MRRNNRRHVDDDDGREESPVAAAARYYAPSSRLPHHHDSFMTPRRGNARPSRRREYRYYSVAFHQQQICRSLVLLFTTAAQNADISSFTATRARRAPEVDFGTDIVAAGMNFSHISIPPRHL